MGGTAMPSVTVLSDLLESLIGQATTCQGRTPESSGPLQKHLSDCHEEISMCTSGKLRNVAASHAPFLLKAVKELTKTLAKRPECSGDAAKACAEAALEAFLSLSLLTSELSCQPIDIEKLRLNLATRLVEQTLGALAMKLVVPGLYALEAIQAKASKKKPGSSKKASAKALPSDIFAAVIGPTGFEGSDFTSIYVGMVLNGVQALALGNGTHSSALDICQLIKATVLPWIDGLSADDPATAGKLYDASCRSLLKASSSFESPTLVADLEILRSLATSVGMSQGANIFGQPSVFAEQCHKIGLSFDKLRGASDNVPQIVESTCKYYETMWDLFQKKPIEWQKELTSVAWCEHAALSFCLGGMPTKGVSMLKRMLGYSQERKEPIMNSSLSSSLAYCYMQSAICDLSAERKVDLKDHVVAMEKCAETLQWAREKLASCKASHRSVLHMVKSFDCLRKGHAMVTKVHSKQLLPHKLLSGYRRVLLACGELMLEARSWENTHVAATERRLNAVYKSNMELFALASSVRFNMEPPGDREADINEAAELLDKALDAASEPAKDTEIAWISACFYSYGTSLYSKGEYKAAIRPVRRSIDLDGSDGGSSLAKKRQILSYCLSKSEDLSSALKLAEQSVLDSLSSGRKDDSGQVNWASVTSAVAQVVRTKVQVLLSNTATNTEDTMSHAQSLLNAVNNLGVEVSGHVLELELDCLMQNHGGSSGDDDSSNRVMSYCENLGNDLVSVYGGGSYPFKCAKAFVKRAAAFFLFMKDPSDGFKSVQSDIDRAIEDMKSLTMSEADWQDEEDYCQATHELVGVSVLGAILAFRGGASDQVRQRVNEAVDLMENQSASVEGIGGETSSILDTYLEHIGGIADFFRLFGDVKSEVRVLSLACSVAKGGSERAYIHMRIGSCFANAGYRHISNRFVTLVGEHGNDETTTFAGPLSELLKLEHEISSYSSSINPQNVQTSLEALDSIIEHLPDVSSPRWRHFIAMRNFYEAVYCFHSLKDLYAAMSKAVLCLRDLTELFKDSSTPMDTTLSFWGLLHDLLKVHEFVAHLFGARGSVREADYYIHQALEIAKNMDCLTWTLRLSLVAFSFQIRRMPFSRPVPTLAKSKEPNHISISDIQELCNEVARANSGVENALDSVDVLLLEGEACYRCGDYNGVVACSDKTIAILQGALKPDYLSGFLACHPEHCSSHPADSIGNLAAVPATKPKGRVTRKKTVARVAESDAAPISFEQSPLLADRYCQAVVLKARSLVHIGDAECEAMNTLSQAKAYASLVSVETAAKIFLAEAFARLGSPEAVTALEKAWSCDTEDLSKSKKPPTRKKSSKDALEQTLEILWLALDTIGNVPFVALRREIMNSVALCSGPLAEGGLKCVSALAGGQGITIRHQMSLLLARLKDRKRPESMDGSSNSNLPTDDIDDLVSDLNQFSFDSVPECKPKGRGRGKPPSREVTEDMVFSEDVYSCGKEFAKVFTEDIPESWTVCSVSLCNEDRIMVLSRLNGNDSPITVRTPATLESIKETLDDYSEILLDSKESVSGGLTDMTEKQKRQWWDLRQDLDSKMQKMLSTIGDRLFGWTKALLLGRPSSVDMKGYLAAAVDEVRSALTSAGISADERILESLVLASEWLSDKQLVQGVGYATGNKILDKFTEKDAIEFLREVAKPVVKEFRSSALRVGGSAGAGGEAALLNPVIMILDKRVQHMPFESMPILRFQPMSRVPCMAILRYQLMQHGPSGTVDPSSAFYLLNPSRDLASTQKALEPIFRQVQAWEGIVCQAPSHEQYKLALEMHDLFIYCGHSAGEQYLQGEKLKHLTRCAVSLLMGCSSGLLRDSGDFEPSGMVLYYLLAGCPAAVANLWDVTDRDIDRYSEALLRLWLPHLFESPGSQATKKPSKVPSKTPAKTPAKSRSKPEAPSHESCLVTQVFRARDACRLQNLVGAAPICYGIPVTARTRTSWATDPSPVVKTPARGLTKRATRA